MKVRREKGNEALCESYKIMVPLLRLVESKCLCWCNKVNKMKVGGEEFSISAKDVMYLSDRFTTHGK